MAFLYLDEDIPIEVASLLTSAGHPTRTTVAVGRVGRWDAEQLLYATEQGWTIVTHNRRDFRALHESWLVWSFLWREPRPHGGILTLDKGNRLVASDYVTAILTLLTVDSLALANTTFEWFARNGGEWIEWRPVNQFSQ
jgi:Domain of unknown function (DUF5615)